LLTRADLSPAVDPAPVIWVPVVLLLVLLDLVLRVLEVVASAARSAVPV
jgi:hypothetical protein